MTLDPAQITGQILIGDAAEQLTRLPAGSVDMVVTSPPYFRLRDYGQTTQLGLEDHVEQWVDGLRNVARELARVLTPTGSLWLNLGDSYSTHQREGVPRKGLLLAPERLLLGLTDDGWLVRNKVVWAKTRSIPSPVRDRLTTTWEPIYFLTRSPDYYFDLDAVRVPHTSVGKTRPLTNRPAGRREAAGRGPNAQPRSGLAKMRAAGRVGHPLGKNPGDVWALATASSRTGHPAIYPVQLAERIIRAACPVAVCTACDRAALSTTEPACTCGAALRAGRVLDPFMGSGTTAVAAERLDRDWLGIELNPAYARAAAERISTAQRERPPPGGRTRPTRSN